MNFNSSLPILKSFIELNMIALNKQECYFFKRTNIIFSPQNYLQISVNFFPILGELDNMNSTERISFLQEKLQEIRKYYMSLKSEVATIDRRRKRLKKKDREGNFVRFPPFPILLLCVLF